MEALRGLSAFPITPSNEAGVVDIGALKALLSPLVEARVDSIGLLGSTGSYPYLARDQRRRAIETAVGSCGNIPVVVGIGALRTDDALKLAQDAKSAGAAVGLLAPMTYTPLTDDEVFGHFATVAEQSGLPICIYDNPSTTHFSFSANLVGRLSRVPGIVGIKSPATEAPVVKKHLADLRAVASDNFSLGYSVDWFSVEAMIAGGETWYSVLGGVCPKVCVAIVDAVRRGDVTNARALDEKLQPIWSLFRQLSSLRVVYCIAELRGLAVAKPPLPIRPLTEQAKAQVLETMDRLKID